MEQYTALAQVYDALVPASFHRRFAHRAQQLFIQEACPPKLILDLACGTGTLALELSQMGYELIACDASEDMLSAAQRKCQGLNTPPVFLCQEMGMLNLYGTVDAAVCSLDSINYLIDPEEAGRTIKRVSLFLNPGGLFLFDVKTPALFEEMAGQVSVDEPEGAYCVWQYGYDPVSMLAEHRVDLFLKRQKTYERYFESHIQRAYTRTQLEEMLANAGLQVVNVYRGFSSRIARKETGRLLFAARKNG